MKEINYFNFGEMFNYLLKLDKTRKEWPTETPVNLHLFWKWERREGEERHVEVILKMLGVSFEETITQNRMQNNE